MKHKLDELTDDLLKHYGVKGMKWGVRNNNNESSSQDAAGGGGGGEEEEEGFFDDLMDDVDDLTGAAKAKLKDVKKDLKIKGRNLAYRLFGKPAVFGNMQKSSVQSMFSKNQLTVYKDLDTGFTVKRRTPNESNSFKSVAKEQISNSKTAARKDRERASNRKKAKELVRNRY